MTSMYRCLAFATCRTGLPPCQRALHCSCCSTSSHSTDGGVRSAHQCCSATRLETHYCCRAVCLPGRAYLHGHRPSASTEMYWSETFGHPFITSLFSRDRFKQLLRFFRVVQHQIAAAPAWSSPSCALTSLRSWIAPLPLTSLQPSISHSTRPWCAYKGRSPIKQYIPIEATQVGIQDLLSGQWGLFTALWSVWGKGGAIQRRGRHLRHGHAHDSTAIRISSTSSSLTIGLLLLLSCRTAAERHPPVRLCAPQSQRNASDPQGCEVDALGQGEWIQRQKGDMTVAVWKDQKAMWLLYNHCSPSETASLDRWSDAGNKISIGCPQRHPWLLLRCSLCRCRQSAALRLPHRQEGHALLASPSMVAAGYVHHQCLQALVDGAAASQPARFPRTTHAWTHEAAANRRRTTKAWSRPPPFSFTDYRTLSSALNWEARLRGMQSRARQPRSISHHLRRMQSAPMHRSMLFSLSCAVIIETYPYMYASFV